MSRVKSRENSAASPPAMVMGSVSPAGIGWRKAAVERLGYNCEGRKPCVLDLIGTVAAPVVAASRYHR